MSSLAILASSLICPSNQVYVKMTKKTASWAGEESFKILSGSTVVYTSPSLVNNQERVIEQCITASNHNQYTLQMSDSAGDSWSDGAWLMIEGINGNVMYKVMMTESRTQTEPLSLYSPINLGSDWKYKNGVTGNWKDVNFPDSDWTSVTLGISAQSAPGTQYFRKTFEGINDMAAFELQMKYRYGVVAYINGNEVYRDNMPDGEPSSSTLASGEYNSFDYHGIIRSAQPVTQSSVLAVEIHPLTSDYQEIIQFNSFLSLFAGLSTQNNCYVAPTSTTITATGFLNGVNAGSWTRNSGATLTTPPGTVTFEFTGTSIPLINSYRIWPYSSPTNAPVSFTIEGSQSSTSNWQTILVNTAGGYVSSQWKQYDMVTLPPKFSFIRFTAQSSQSGNIILYELQFLVCNRPLPTSIEYPETQYSFYRNREQVHIAPTDFGYYGCSISPALPNGISIDPDTCIISGMTDQLLTSTPYQITSTMGSLQLQTTLSIAFTDCSGTLYKITRSYTTSPQYEYFRIRDSSDDSILYQIQSSHSHPANTEWVHYVCITVDRFDISFYSLSTAWASNSYYRMYYMLPDGEQEMVVKGRYDNYQSNVHNVYVRRPSIKDSEQWYYKMGEVPTNWHNADTSGWQQAARGSFPTSSNRIQLYKKTFNIASLNEVSGLNME
ncbi:hypothetical protein JH06_5160 [Blastocystis sp. subtype 4]|uniref:hypothetical protein n=1 Tax=Blastocystis sp. subtype 4 TaxID=944170 RepID=UPI000711DF24|nr:hypothetical protein JH06_5160 [Blastocystis sp. subtype 4]KNB41579.1 hypothetical protein JH06_5160 [Blastocystis sp. subtype 4]|eukprot:XP_014525022.1 hypothetical protein JH06_5160 [Blastocystis sp. subtype 4]